MHIVRKGKRNNNKHTRTNKAGKEDKKRITKQSPEDRQRRRKAEDKRKKQRQKEKTEANTPQASNPPNSTRAQKPHKPRKDLNPYKYTSAPQNPLKTPLKREIGAYSGETYHKQSEKAGKSTEHTTRGPEPAFRQVLNPRKVLHTHTSRHAKRQASRAGETLTPCTHFQKYIRILTVSVSENPEVRQKHTK